MSGLIAPSEASSIAHMPRHAGTLSPVVVGRDEKQRLALCARLALKGQVPASFKCVADLLADLRRGRRFGVLLLHLEESMAWGELSAVRKLQGMPTLLIAPDAQWTASPVLDDDFWGTGTVDFIVSPVADHDLEWRMRALLLRARASLHRTVPHEDLVRGDYRILVRDRLVLHRGREIPLDPREFELALLLFLNMDALLTRDLLWIALWKKPPRKGARALDNCAAGLRRKLDLREENGAMLCAWYGRGYELRSTMPHAAGAPGAA